MFFFVLFPSGKKSLFIHLKDKQETVWEKIERKEQRQDVSEAK